MQILAANSLEFLRFINRVGVGTSLTSVFTRYEKIRHCLQCPLKMKNCFVNNKKENENWSVQIMQGRLKWNC